VGERERRRAGRAQEAAARGRRCRRGRAAFGRERHAGAGPDAGTQSSRAGGGAGKNARVGSAQPLPVKKIWNIRYFSCRVF